MAEFDVAAYKEAVFGNNGQSSIQPPTPEEPKVETPAKQESKPLDQPTVETKPADKPADTPLTPIDDKLILKENLGFEKWEDAKAAVAELNQLREAAKTPQEIKFANDQSKAAYEALVAGDMDKVYDILDTQKRISAIDNMKPAEVIKLHIKEQNKHYREADIEDVFEEKYTYPEKPTQKEDEEPEDFKVREDKWKAAKEKIDRRIERDSVTAKTELSKLKSELKFPEIQKSQTAKDEGYERYQQEQLAIAEVQKAEKEAYSKLSPKDISMVFKFSDEANKLAFDVAYEPEKENFDKAIEQSADITKFFENFYNQDGSPDRIKQAKAIYAAQNIEKIVSEAMVAATNQTIKWFLSNQKNIGDRTQRQFTMQAPTEIDKLKEQVFGKTG